MENKDRKVGSFAGFVLLGQTAWDKKKFLRDLENDWDIRLIEDESEPESDGGDLIFADAGGFHVAVGLVDKPIPGGEAEYWAEGNYLWSEAVEEVKKTKAHLMICTLGTSEKHGDLLAKAELYVKLCTAALKQEGALALYEDGAVYQPEFYLECAKMMNEGLVPVLNLVWFGIFKDDKRGGAYTYGMRRFNKREMEIYVEPEKCDFDEIRRLLWSVAAYVIDCDAELKDGETIGFSDEQKLPIEISDGICLDGQTAKIIIRTDEQKS